MKIAAEIKAQMLTITSKAMRMPFQLRGSEALSSSSCSEMGKKKKTKMKLMMK